MKSLSSVQLFETLWTIAQQAPLSFGILQARILEWVAVPPPGDRPHPGIKPRSPALQADSLPSEPPGKNYWNLIPNNSTLWRLNELHLTELF